MLSGNTTGKSFSWKAPKPPPALLRSCHDAGLAAEGNGSLSASLVVWEASASFLGTMTPVQAADVKDRLCQGSSLLLTLGELAGLTPLLLGDVLPTTGWGTQLRYLSYLPAEPLVVGSADVTIYAARSLEGMTVPYAFDIRPSPAIELGQSKYERYAFVHPLLKTPVAARSWTWTRSLLNRDWRMRVRGNDIAQLPLLVTGRYGAGRIAVVATSLAGIEATSQAGVFWASLLKWLVAEDAKAPNTASAISMKTSIRGGKAQVHLSNASSRPAAVEVAARVTTATGALLPYGQSELLQTKMVRPQQTALVEFDLGAHTLLSAGPVPDAEPLRLRIGAVSPDGKTLLGEQTVLSDNRRPLRLVLRTDNIERLQYPYHAPGRHAFAAFQNRMGFFVGGYAYLPGQLITGEVYVHNGSINVAPRADIRDLTNPGNVSVMTLNDESVVMRKVPSDNIEGYGMWTGATERENVLEFSLPLATIISEIRIVGNPDTYYGWQEHNPGAVAVEVDGHEVARLGDIDDAFVSGVGTVRVPFAPTLGKVVTVRFPWVATTTRNQRPRQAPWLGEIVVLGWTAEAPASHSGSVKITLFDALCGTRTEVATLPAQVSPNTVERISFQARLPDTKRTSFYRLEAVFGHASAHVPVLMISPSSMLLPLDDLRPPKAANTGMIVSRGFREFSHVGTGVGETIMSWSQPDDLIWSYSRNFKSIPANSTTEANRLYVTESDLRHYITPWRAFPNGELFLPEAAQLLVENMKKSVKWNYSEKVVIFFADAWDTGPNLSAMHGWQDFVEFDLSLKAAGGTGLTCRTRKEIADEIHTKHENEWQVWQLQRYMLSVRALRNAFAAENKTLVLSAQGVPMVAGDSGVELARTYQGLADDSTWSMVENSPVLTMGRQFALLAFNPVWRMTTLIAWSFNSSVLNNWQWHSPAGTLEPSRRQMYHRAWRATVWLDGRYSSVYTYGYSANVGLSYSMTEHDYQEWWYLQERHSLISPEEPLGAGLLISSQKAADPRHLRFNCGDPLILDEALLVTKAFRLLHEAGISLPFAANIRALEHWSGNAPLIVLNLQDFSEDEVLTLAACHSRGSLLLAFAEMSTLSASMRRLFSQTGTLLIEREAVSLTRAEIQSMADKLIRALRIPISFPSGTAGYAFRSQNIVYIVVEDWLESEREIDIRFTKSRDMNAASACDVNDGAPLKVESIGPQWSIRVPLRSADGVLIALVERAS